LGEISGDTLVELLVNALIRRDYLKSAPISIMIFDNRMEKIGSGKLPNSLAVEEAIPGNPLIRKRIAIKPE
jgi:predicted HTH transcriptional regulator